MRSDENTALRHLIPLIIRVVARTPRHSNSPDHFAGREDIDVRMLGTGRPFVVQLINPHRIRDLAKTLTQLESKINDVAKSSMRVSSLRRVTRQHADALNAAQDGKVNGYLNIRQSSFF